MKAEDQTGNIGHTARLALVLALTVLTVVLTVENLLLGWELWMLPVLAAGLLAAWALMILNTLPGRTMTILFSSMLMLETFYYGAHCANLFRIAPVAIVAMMLYALTMDRRLVRCGIAVGYITTFFRLAGEILGGQFDFGAENVFITVAHLALLAFAGFVCLRFVGLWESLQSGHGQQMAQLEAERAQINDFLTNVSHEIRTPVNAVIGLSKLLERRAEAAELKRDLLSVQDAGLRIADELDDILDYTEVDMDRAAVTDEPYMPASLVNDVLSEVRRGLRKGVALVVDVDPAIPCVLTGDRVKLKRVLRHLIENGLKFTEMGCVAVEIGATERPYGVNLCLRVADTGPGIDADTREHLSERFYKRSSGRTQSTGGLGLGLPIVSGFVRLMGGFMVLGEAEGGGAEVTVSIPQGIADAAPCMALERREGMRVVACVNFRNIEHPAAREAYQRALRHAATRLGLQMTLIEDPAALEAALDDASVTHLLMDAGSYAAAPGAAEAFAARGTVIVAAGEDFALPKNSRAHLLDRPICTFQAVSLLNTSNAPGEASEGERVTFPGVRALIVDDEPTNLTVAEGLLSAYDMTVATADSGPEALRMYAEEPFDLVFMDHMMPGMDGVEAARRLRIVEREKGRNLYIIALTANTVSGAKALFRQEGFDGFVAKPIDVLELDRTLRTVLPRATVVRSEEAAPPEAPGQTLAEGLARAGVSMQTGLGYCGNRLSLYTDVLSQFAASGPVRLDELGRFLEGEDWAGYAISVHAVKSTSKMIGAQGVSDQAAALEAAAKAGDAETILARHGAFMADYAALAEAVATLTRTTEAAAEPAAEVTDPGAARALLHDLAAALDDYDADAAEAALRALEASGAAPGGTIRTLREQIDAFDFKAAGETVAEALALPEGRGDA